MVLVTTIFFYADDSVLMAPSPSSLQVLINICQEFAHDNGLIYSMKKTKVLMVPPKLRTNIVCPVFYMK